MLKTTCNKQSQLKRQRPYRWNEYGFFWAKMQSLTGYINYSAVRYIVITLLFGLKLHPNSTKNTANKSLRLGSLGIYKKKPALRQAQ
ncbi:hypothetical protein ACX27_06260 [Nostoc piscinale CENA21]|uniref:Uncharacterized protein n=1 Tax=Nostoc piscinale CENA21 TaxID=224013 RepID=A0A0M4SJ23_9NOSO|nr:hypothetical protein ACX27_06260 [Nostoc piscinale CENA21]